MLLGKEENDISDGEFQWPSATWSKKSQNKATFGLQA